MFGNCPVTVMWRVTAIYRAVIYRFDCTNRIGVNCNHYIGNSLQRTDDSADEVTLCLCYKVHERIQCLVLLNVRVEVIVKALLNIDDRVHRLTMYSFVQWLAYLQVGENKMPASTDLSVCVFHWNCGFNSGILEATRIELNHCTLMRELLLSPYFFYWFHGDENDVSFSCQLGSS